MYQYPRFVIIHSSNADSGGVVPSSPITLSENYLLLLMSMISKSKYKFNPDYALGIVARRKRAQQICASSGNENYYWVRSSSYAEPVYASFGFRPSGERLVSKGISFRLMEKGEKNLI